MNIKNILNRLVPFALASLFIWCVWQHEVLFIYQSIRGLSWDIWWSQPATIFTGITFTHGIVYDLTLLGGFLSFGGLYMWKDIQFENLKKTYKEVSLELHLLKEMGGESK